MPTHIQHLHKTFSLVIDGTKANKLQLSQFTLASADESKTAVGTAKLAGVPAWRVVLGNVAAGATAGCAVEAGDTYKWPEVAGPTDEHVVQISASLKTAYCQLTGLRMSTNQCLGTDFLGSAWQHAFCLMTSPAPLR